MPSNGKGEHLLTSQIGRPSLYLSTLLMLATPLTTNNTILLICETEPSAFRNIISNGSDQKVIACYLGLYVTVSAKTILNGTFIITRKTDLKYSRCCGSVVLDFSHA